ncbi:MAG: hypothetical protein AB1896_08060 [Thermodesulfobacteriota bacterium]
MAKRSSAVIRTTKEIIDGQMVEITSGRNVLIVGLENREVVKSYINGKSMRIGRPTRISSTANDDSGTGKEKSIDK